MLLKDLEPVSAHLCLEIEKVCRKRLGLLPGQKLLLAVSGGADSLALALIMHVLAPRLRVSLSALHVNHMLRPEAQADAELAASFCAKLDIPCALVSANIAELAQKRHCGVEEAGREARRTLLEKQAASVNASQILLAHHKEDLAEDILMRLVRGAGWPGLGGMGWRNGIFARPLLHTDPKDLRELLLTCGLTWREDASNESLAFRRNRFRHLIMPLLRCENPAISSGLARLHRQAQLDEDYWHTVLSQALAAEPWKIESSQNGVELFLPAALLRGLHVSVRMRLYHIALNKIRKLRGAGGQNRADYLERLDRAWLSGIGGKTVQCGGKVRAICKNGGISFQAGNGDAPAV